MVKFNREWVVNAILLRELISNTECPMLNNEVKTSRSKFNIHYSILISRRMALKLMVRERSSVE